MHECARPTSIACRGKYRYKWPSSKKDWGKRKWPTEHFHNFSALKLILCSSETSIHGLRGSRNCEMFGRVAISGSLLHVKHPGQARRWGIEMSVWANASFGKIMMGAFEADFPTGPFTSLKPCDGFWSFKIVKGSVGLSQILSIWLPAINLFWPGVAGSLFFYFKSDLGPWVPSPPSFVLRWAIIITFAYSWEPQQQQRQQQQSVWSRSVSFPFEV